MGKKRKADGITRSHYEIYSFATKYNLPEADTDELLAMLSNVLVSACCCCFRNDTICSNTE